MGAGRDLLEEVKVGPRLDLMFAGASAGMGAGLTDDSDC